jgi:hypothetical protein
MSKNPLFCEPAALRTQPSSNQPFAACKPAANTCHWASVQEPSAAGHCDYALIKSAPDVRPQDVEVPESIAVDVTILWGSNVIHASHVTPPGTFTVGQFSGKGTACDFFMPEEVLGERQLTLLDVRAAMPTAIIPRQAQGFIEMPGQPRTTLDEMRKRQQPSTSNASMVQLPMPFGSRICLKIGDFSFQFASVRAGKPVARDLLPSADREVLSFFGVSLAAIASFVVAMAYFVPAQSYLDDQPFDEDQIVAMTQFLHASAERERDAKDDPQTSNAATHDTEGGTGTRAKYEEGAMGNPTSRAHNQRYGVQGPSNNPDPHVARERLLWEAQHEGMIGLLTSGIAGDPRAPTSPWGRDESLGRDAMSADGVMWGDNIGDSFGMHGLGLTGIGQGGGGLGEGIGLGSLGGLGNGAGLGAGQGFGRGNGNLGHGNHKVRAFGMRPEVTTVSGRLPPEVIQRIVRQNYGRFRNCYEQGLSHNPNLEGRVQARFIIGRDGAVVNVQNGGSDLPDSGVVSCVISAYYGLSFPQPDGGIVTVVYPIMFQPG